MRINYVIPFYIIDGSVNGIRSNTYHKIDKFFALKAHILTLYKNHMPDVVKATFVINKSEFVKEGEIEDVISSIRNRWSIEIPIEVKYRENWGYSYGAWEHHIRESLNEQYDYYFLTEDDYIVSPQQIVFYQPFLTKFTEKTAFVCGLWLGTGKILVPSVLDMLVDPINLLDLLVIQQCLMDYTLQKLVKTC